MIVSDDPRYALNINDRLIDSSGLRYITARQYLVITYVTQILNIKIL